MAENEQAPENEETVPATPSAGKKMVPILLVVLGGLIFGGASGFFMVGPAVARKVTGAVVAAKTDAKEAPAAKNAEADAPSADSKIFLLDNMVLNPAGSSGQRFLLVSIALRLKDAETEAELKARDAEVRDALLRVLGGKHVEELSDISQRDRIKEELRTALDAVVKPGAVKGLYFPQFVIQ